MLSVGSLVARAVALMVAGAGVIAGPLTHAAPMQPGTLDGVRLELVDQRVALDPNGDIHLRYLITGLDGDPLELIPPPIPEPPPPASIPDLEEPTETTTPVVVEPVALTLQVVNYAPLTDPADVSKVVGSDVDPQVFGDFGPPVDGIALDARPLLTRNDDGTVNLGLDIGTDVTDSVESRLKFENPGVYPLGIQLLRGQPGSNDVIATAGTIIQRLPGAVDAGAVASPPIDLAVVTALAGLRPDADADAVVVARDQLDRSIALAAALAAPVTLEVPPNVIAGTAATPDGRQRLEASLTNDELVALPIVPLDVSSAVAAGRADAYTRLVRAGEDLLAEAVPTTPTRRDVWVTTEPLSAGGAQHLRDLGTRLVVIPADVFAASIDFDRPPTDLFIQAELPDGGSLPFLVVDPLAEQLTESAADRILASATATEWGVETIGTMLVEQARDDRAAANESRRFVAPARRSRILTSPDLLSPDVRLIGALEALAQTTPSIRLTAASALTGVTDFLAEDGDPVAVRLPKTAGPSLADRLDLLDGAALQLASAASMLPSDDPRIAQWSSRLDELISTSYSDADVEAATAELVAQAGELKSAVQLPEPFTFTLTGRSGNIEIRIGNTLDEPLDVIVRLESTKITFPEGEQRVTLRPLDETGVNVPVTAEANGTSSIELTVSTPAGESLAAPVTLTARVTALTGLGQLLTGGLVIVLLTWWFTHWRSRRRATLTGNGRERHPAGRELESDPL